VNPPKDFTTGARVLFDALQGGSAHVWDDVWSQLVTSRYADYALSQIHLESGEVDAAFVQLDDPCKRSELVRNDSVAIDDCVERLMQSKTHLNDALNAAKINTQSNIQLKRLLKEGGVVSALIDTAHSVGTLVAIDSLTIWKAVAHKIAQEVHSGESSRDIRTPSRREMPRVTAE
jgi:hypothetical protein